MATATLNPTASDLGVIESSDLYRLEENTNHYNGQSNCYLILNGTRQCLGSVTRAIGGDWQTSILGIPEDGYTTVSEAIFVGDHESAIETLWNNRNEAYRY